MRRIFIFVSVLSVVAIFAALFVFLMRDMPKERTIYVQNAAEAERAISEGDKVTIGFRLPPRLVAVVRDKTSESLITADDQTIYYRDISSIRKGTRPFIQGDAWNLGQPLSGAEKVLIPGQTVTVELRGPNPITSMIKHKGTDDFTTDDGRRIAYKDVAYVTKEIWWVERIGRAVIAIPFLLLWAFTDLIAVIAAKFGVH